MIIKLIKPFLFVLIFPVIKGVLEYFIKGEVTGILTLELIAFGGYNRPCGATLFLVQACLRQKHRYNKNGNYNLFSVGNKNFKAFLCADRAKPNRRGI